MMSFAGDFRRSLFFSNEKYCLNDPKAQNQIIRDTTSKFMLIEGIAGSGKTSALLQRVAFLLYRNRKWLDEEQVLLFSPNHLFSDYISMVLPSLGESEVPTRTFHHFIQRALPNFQITKETQLEETFLSGADDRIEKIKSSLKLVKLIQRYVQKISAIGPLFRDLKFKDRHTLRKNKSVVGIKKQIKSFLCINGVNYYKQNY